MRILAKKITAGQWFQFCYGPNVNSVAENIVASDLAAFCLLVDIEEIYGIKDALFTQSCLDISKVALYCY